MGWETFRIKSHADRENCHPYSAFCILINILDDVSIHLVGMLMVGREIRLQFLGLHIQSVYTVPVRGNQGFVGGIQVRDNSIDGDVTKVANVLQCFVRQSVMVESVTHGADEQGLGRFMKGQVLHDMEILQLWVMFKGKPMSVQVSRVNLMVGCNEKLLVCPLADGGDFFLDGTFQPGESPVGGVVNVLRVSGTEPQALFFVHPDMRQGNPTSGVDTVRKIHHQVVVVRIGVVFEDVSVLVQNPDASVIVHMDMAHVREMLDVVLAVAQFIVDVFFSVVSVHSFVSKKPHVSFGVLFDGNHPSAAQSVFRFQISI